MLKPPSLFLSLCAGMFIALLLSCAPSTAQTVYCPPNLNFEDGVVAPWHCYTGTCCPISPGAPTAPITNRHTIMTGSVTDPYGGFPVVAPGGTYSLRLGNNMTGAQSERVRYNIHVPVGATNFVLVYYFAVVFQNPTHTAAQQPRFEVNLYDSTTEASLPCGYISYVSSSSLPGFHLSPVPASDPVYYHEWDSATVNLTAYAGHTVLLDFSTGDCSLGAHFGYAYVDVRCGSFLNTVYTCDTSAMLTFTAPPGYGSYDWYDSSTFTTYYGSGSSITLPNPGVPTTYAVILNPYTGLGCKDTSYVRVYPSALTINPSHDTVICPGDMATLTVGAADMVGPLTYAWTPGGWLSCDTCNSTTAFGVSTVTYSVTVTNPYGCHKDTTITVAVGPPAGTVTGPAAICIGSTAAFTASTPGGTWSISGAAASISASGIVTAITAGTAIVSYNVPTICGPGTATAIVTIDSTPIALISGPPVMCTSGTATLTGITAGGTWSASGGATVSAAGVASGISVGTAIFTYTFTNACGVAVDTMGITVEPLPLSATISGPTELCVGGTITMTSSLPGGVWSCTPIATATINTTGVVTGVAAGPATVSYTMSNSCGTASATRVVTVNPYLTAAITGGHNLCLGSGLTLVGTPAGGSWTASGVVTVLAGAVTAIIPGTGTVTYTVSNICNTSTATHIVTVTASPSPNAIMGPGEVCVGSTIALSSFPAGGTWSSTVPTVGTISATGVLSGIAIGTTTVSYTLANICDTVSATTVVTVNPLPVAGTISGPSSVCVGSTIALTSSTTGGVWSTMSAYVSVSSTGVVSGLSSGTALISYSVTNMCGTAVATKIVTINPLPVAGTLTGPGMVCVGSTIVITSTSPGGTWNSSLPSVATVSATGVVTGVMAGVTNISYSVTNVCGTAVASNPVTVNPLPVAGTISGPSTVCEGSTVALTSSVGGGTWSCTGSGTISSTGVVTGVTPGTTVATYTVTNMCGAAIATKLLTVNPLPHAGVISGGPMVCTGATITMSTTASGGIWSCSAGATISGTGILTGTGAGTTTVTYTVSNSCGTDVATLVITVNASPDAGAISGPPRVCVGETITLTESVGGGTWSSNNPTIAPVSSSGVVTGLIAGVVTISYKVTNTYCTSYATKIVTIDPLAVPGTIVGDTDLCVGDAITMSSTQPGGTWSIGGATTATISATGVVSGLAFGSALVTYTVTNICGPVSTTQEIMVFPIPDPGTISGPGTMCLGDTIVLSDPAGPMGTWTSSAPTIADVNVDGVVTGKSPGVATITYAVAQTTGCVGYAYHTITVFPLPPAGNISGTPTLCAGFNSFLTETVSGGTWSSSNPAVASINGSTGEVTAVSAGTVTITYTTAPSADGCVDRVTFPLTVLSTPPFTIKETQHNVSCNSAGDGSLAVFINGGTGPWRMLWSTGSTAHLIKDLQPGAYTIEVYDSTSGCLENKTYTISEPDFLNAAPLVKNSECELANGVIILNASGGTAPYTYQWTNNSAADRMVDVPVGSYSVTITDDHDCKKELAVDVIDDGCSDIVVHDGLTPNGDGTNDLWVIDGLQIYRNNLVQLFDKWGDKVFEQRGYNNRWDGRGTNGSLLPDGTYFYVIHLNAQNGAGGKNVLTGSMLIKR